jgi:hypothetical protein
MLSIGQRDRHVAVAPPGLNREAISKLRQLVLVMDLALTHREDWYDGVGEGTDTKAPGEHIIGENVTYPRYSIQSCVDIWANEEPRIVTVCSRGESRVR